MGVEFRRRPGRLERIAARLVLTGAVVMLVALSVLGVALPDGSDSLVELGRYLWIGAGAISVLGLAVNVCANKSRRPR